MATPSRDASRSSRIGSASALWNAFAVLRRTTRTLSESKRSESAWMPSAGPLTTWWVPLSPEMLTGTPEDAALKASTSAATLSGGANTAAMAPAFMPDISDPRAHAKRIPSSRLNTPAACAAAISPTLWPSTTSGRTPTLDQSAVSAHSSA